MNTIGWPLNPGLLGLVLLKRDDQTIPGWAIILEKCLQKIGFRSIENLLLSAEHADLHLVRKHLNKLGFVSRAMVFDNLIAALVSNDDIGPRLYKKKKNHQNNEDQTPIHNEPPTNGPQNSKESRNQNHHGTYKQPT